MKNILKAASRIVLLSGFAVLGLGLSAHGQTLVHTFQAPLPVDDKQLQEQLKDFDPAAVAAARHYYQSASVKADMVTMTQGLTPSIIASIEKQTGKPLTADDKVKVSAASSRAASAHMDMLIGLNMVAALQTLSREQLVALDQFYTSPVGQGILAKMPQLNARLPGIFQIFVSQFSESMEAEMKTIKLSTN